MLRSNQVDKFREKNHDKTNKQNRTSTPRQSLSYRVQELSTRGDSCIQIPVWLSQPDYSPDTSQKFLLLKFPWPGLSTRFLPNICCQVLPTPPTILKLPFLCSSSSGISDCPSFLTLPSPGFLWFHEKAQQGAVLVLTRLLLSTVLHLILEKEKKAKRKPAQQTQIQVPSLNHSSNSAPDPSPAVPATSLQLPP